MLGRGELVPRRERTVDRADVQGASVGRRFPPDVLGDVGEGHEGFALRERRQRPFRDAQDAQPCQRQTTLEDFSTRGLCVHVVALSVTDRTIGSRQYQGEREGGSEAPLARWTDAASLEGVCLHRSKECRMAESRKDPVDRREFLKGAAAGAAGAAASCQALPARSSLRLRATTTITTIRPCRPMSRCA